MRYLVLSDLHANLHALEAVLAAVPADAAEQVVVLGDLVGYGAAPNEVVERVRALNPLVIIRGNHDKVACGLETPDEFNVVARQAVLWTESALTAANRDYLRSLPAGPLPVSDRVEICHGSPADEDEYVFDHIGADLAFQHVTRPVCLFGHTHLPGVFTRGQAHPVPASAGDRGHTTITVAPDTLYLVNPGSVGQPRDGDPRAAVALVDDTAGEIELWRVSYPVALAQRAIRDAGLPSVLAARLEAGR
jgi:predicted phosphodiesterase